MNKINLKKKLFIGLLSAISIASLGLGLGIGLANSDQGISCKSTTNTYLENNGFSIEIPTDSSVVNIGNLAYVLNNQNNQATVVGFSSIVSKETNLVIPGLVSNNNQNYVVTNIASGAFYCQGLTSVSFPQTIQAIGADAFADNCLTELNLPNNLGFIGNNAFSNNWFKYGTVVYLPSNCQWSKVGSTCPFPSNLNYGKLTPCVQFVIQNQAVYAYDGFSGNWSIQSYLPSIANNQPNHVRFNKRLFVHRSNDATQNPTGLHFWYSNIGLPVNSSIPTTRIVYKTGKWYDGNLSFVNNKIQLNPAVPGNVNGFKNVNMRVYSPASQSVLFNNSLAKLPNGSISLQNGDVITLFSNSNAYSNIYTGVPTNVEMNANNYGCYNMFYNSGLSDFTDRGMQPSFMVTPDGFVPYQTITTLHQNVLNSKASEPITVTGHSLANHKVEISYGKTNLTVNSDANGNFSFKIPNTTPINTIVNVSCQGTVPTSFKLIGANPIQSALMFNISYKPVGIQNYVQFGICPDGYNNTFQLWNNSVTTMPTYNNPDPAVTSNGFTNVSEWGINGTWFLGLGNGNIVIQNQIYNASGKEVGSSTATINMQNIHKPQDIQTALNSLVYNPEYKNVVTITEPHGSNFVMGAVSNNAFINSGSKQNVMINGQKCDQFSFTITNNQIISNLQYTHTGLGVQRQWNATNNLIVGQDGGEQFNNSDSANWDDPTPLMYQVVHQITGNLQTTYQKAVAIVEWVNQNMHYTDTYDYGHNISDTFNKLEGICGNYAALAAVMCQMAGLVSRVIIGYCGNALNYFANPMSTDHAWMQVWDEELGEWITLDPTWNWYAPYGQVQSSFNYGRSDQIVAMVLWPTGTNYFSYFKNHEYEALYKLGQFYCVAQNSVGNIYPASYAVNLTELLNTAWTMENNQYACVENNNLDSYN